MKKHEANWNFFNSDDMEKYFKNNYFMTQIGWMKRRAVSQLKG